MRSLRALVLPGLLAVVGLAMSPAAQVTLTWNDNANNEDGFTVDRAVGSSGAFLLLTDKAANAATHVDTTVLPGTTYRYRVRAFNTAGVSAWSNEATVSIPSQGSSPLAPSTLALTIPGRLVNISSRGLVSVGDSLVIGGFVVQGGPARVLIRAIGPGLTPFGVAGVLSDPHLQIVGGAANDNWSGADVATAAAAVGAFALTPGSRDAALLVTLPAGQYTVHLTGVGGAEGVALLEIYEIP